MYLSLPSSPSAAGTKYKHPAITDWQRSKYGILPRYWLVVGTLKDRYNHTSYLDDTSIEEGRKSSLNSLEQFIPQSKQATSNCYAMKTLDAVFS